MKDNNRCITRGRTTVDMIAVVEPDGTIAAVFAGLRIPDSAGFIKDEQERARKAGRSDPGLRAVTIFKPAKRGDKLADVPHWEAGK